MQENANIFSNAQLASQWNGVWTRSIYLQKNIYCCLLILKLHRLSLPGTSKEFQDSL